MSLPPRPEYIHIKPPQASRSIRPILAFPVNFHPAVNPQYFSTPILMLLIFLINSKWILTLWKIFSELPASSRNSIIPKFRVFRTISGLPIVFPKVSCFKRTLNQSTTLSNHFIVEYLTHGSVKNNLIVLVSTTQKILDHSLFLFFLFFLFFGFLHRL